MSWVATENFNSYNDGDLNGQGNGFGWSGNWAGSASVDIQGIVTQEGAKAVYFNNPADGDSCVRSLASASDTGNVIFYVRRPNKSYYFRVVLVDSLGNYIAGIEFGPSDITFSITGHSPEVIFSNYSVDTWYKCEIQYDHPNNQHKGRINDGSWSSIFGDIDSGAGAVAKFYARTDQGAGANAYLDNIGPPAAAAAGRSFGYIF
jgi:hypothetical protein